MTIISVGKKALDAMTKVFQDTYRRTILNDMKQAMSFQFAAYVLEHMNTVPWDRYFFHQKLFGLNFLHRAQIVYNRYHGAASQKLAIFNLPKFEDWKQKLEEDSAGDGKIEEDGLLQSLPMKVRFLI